MERLTIPDVRVDEHTTRRSVIDVAAVREHAMEFYCRLKAYEDTGWTPEMLHKLGENAGLMWDFAQAAEKMTVGRLKELAEADRNHQIVIRPCKIGDTVWAADTEPVIPLHVMADAVYLEGRHGGDYERLSNFGSVVFLSQEEAKEAASHWMK